MGRNWVRAIGLVLGLVLGLSLCATNVGAALADPGVAARKQAIDLVIARALSQRGVPYTYGGGTVSGPSRRPDSVPPAADANGVAADSSTTATRGGATPSPSLTPTPGLGVDPLAAATAARDPSADVVGFDSSGLIVYAFGGVGVKMPRSSGEQYEVGRKVLPSQALPGDLIFYGPDGSQSVALFVGNGQMVEGSQPAVALSAVRTANMAPYLTRVIEW